MKRITRPFLGTVDSVLDAFTEIKSIRVDVQHQGEAISELRKSESYSDRNLPSAIPCVNPRCQQGGYQLNATLIALTSSKQQAHRVTWYCSGHEGSPGGRRKGNPCENSVEVNLFLTYQS